MTPDTGGMNQATTNPLQQIQTAFNLMADRIERLESILLQTRRRLAACEAAERVRAAGREPSMPIVFRSQYGEDLFLYEVFKGKTEGFFVECGAFDGVTLSVSYALEAMGWRGLLVEALPEAAAKCRESRPGSQVVHAAVSKRGSSGTTTFSEAVGAGVFSSIEMDAAHERLAREHADEVRRIEVPVTTFDDLLAEHDGAIDALVLDVEGGEIDALDGFDLDRYRPRVMLIEDNVRDGKLAAAVTARGYEAVGSLAVNLVFVRRDEPKLIRRAGAVLVGESRWS